MMEKGEGNQYRGKNLDEININVDDLVSDEHTSTDDEDANDEPLSQLPNRSSVHISSINTPINSPLTKMTGKITTQLSERKLAKKVIIVPWKAEEKSIAFKYFKKHIHLEIAPKKEDCEIFLKTYPQINRPWKKIKDFIHNTIKSQKNKKAKELM